MFLRWVLYGYSIREIVPHTWCSVCAVFMFRAFSVVSLCAWLMVPGLRKNVVCACAWSSSRVCVCVRWLSASLTLIALFSDTTSSRQQFSIHVVVIHVMHIPGNVVFRGFDLRLI